MRIQELARGLAAGVTALALAGCGTRADQPEATASPAAERAERAADKAGEAAEKAGQAAENAAEKAGDALEKAGEKAEPVVEQAGRTLDAARQTVEVKAALMADASVDASKIDVDTDAATRTVTLKGTVPTAAHKAAAERIAKGKANGYTVRSVLVVAGR